MKVLHLASWYPNRTGKQDGDFIQRHIKAVSSYAHAYVIHVVKDEQLNKRFERSVNRSGSLTETIVYYNPFKTGLRLVDKLVSYFTYKRIQRSEVERYLVEYGKPDLVHVHVAMRAGTGALWMKRRLGIPYIISEHWSGYFETDPDNYFTRDGLFRHHTKQVLLNADRVTAVSDSLAKRLSQMFGVSRTSVIFNSVNTAIFSPAYVASDTFRFVHVSNQHPIKNVKGLFEVLSKLRLIRSDWRLTMVGIIDNSYQELAKQLDIAGHIDWRGEIEHHEVPAELQNANTLLMFSQFETLSCVACESLCCGLPIIATRVGGLPEIVNDSNGVLCTPGDQDELLQNILWMMEHYHSYDRPEIAAHARRLFDEPQIGQQFANLYQHVLQSAKS